MPVIASLACYSEMLLDLDTFISFAILIMNAFVPLIDKYIKPKRFGEKLAVAK